MRGTTVLRASLSACLLSALALPLGAQNYGEITGTVSDPSGAVISGATVRATNTATGVGRTVVTNSTGSYSLPFLVPGVYNVQAEQPGFKVMSRPNVELQVSAVARIDFTMELGGASEKVEVTSSAALLATEGTAVGTVIENKRIQDLPTTTSTAAS